MAGGNMHGISDRDLVVAAYKLGLVDGRTETLKELTAIVERDFRTAQQTLCNDAYRKLTSVTELDLSGPAHDALVAKGLVFVCQLTALTAQQFAREVGSNARLSEYTTALAAKGYSFKTKD